MRLLPRLLMEERPAINTRFAGFLAKDSAQGIGSFIFLAAVVGVFAGAMIWDNQVPFFRDLNNYFYPLRFSMADSFSRGEMPLWNRHMAMGFPLLADIQTGAFYPPHFLLKLLPFFSAVRAIFIFHYFIAISGAYLLCRHWGLERSHSLIGASLFFLGGTSVSMINLLNHFQSAVWLPWAVLFWERFLQQVSWGRFVMAVLILVCQLLGGSPEIYAMSAGLLWLSSLNVKPPKNIVNIFGPTCWLIGINLTVMLLAAVQLLPTLELTLSSRRQEAIPYIEAAGWSLHPRTLLNLLFLDKRVDMGLGDATQMFFSLDIPFFISYYFGAIFVPALCLWLWFAKTKERLLLGGLVLGSLFVAFGRFAPIYPILYDNFAVFRGFRFPEKLFFVTQAFLLVAAVRGIAMCLQSHDRRAATAAFGAYAGLISIVYSLLRFSPTALWTFVVQQKTVPLPLHLTINNTAAAMVSLERQLVLALALFALFYLGKTNFIRDGLFKTLLILVVLLDLVGAHQPFQYLLKPQPILDKPKVVEARETRGSRIFYYPQGVNLHPSSFVIHKPVTTPFSEIATSVATNLLPNFGVLYGYDYMQDINALAKNSYIEFLRYANPQAQEKQIRLLAALNIRHVISFKALSTDGLKFLGYFPEHPSWLYEVENHVPRAYIAQNTLHETTPTQMMEQFTKPGWDFRAQVFVDQVTPIQPTTNFSARAEIVDYGNLSVVMKTDSNGPGVLVLADSYFPGWRVYVDGKEEKLLRANYFFRGVGIDAGKHRVEFRYEPMSFAIGLVISLTTAGTLCLVTAVLIARKRRKIPTISGRKVLAPVPAP